MLRQLSPCCFLGVATLRWTLGTRSRELSHDARHPLTNDRSWFTRHRGQSVLAIAKMARPWLSRSRVCNRRPCPLLPSTVTGPDAGRFERHDTTTGARRPLYVGLDSALANVDPEHGTVLLDRKRADRLPARDTSETIAAACRSARAVRFTSIPRLTPSTPSRQTGRSASPTARRSISRRASRGRAVTRVCRLGTSERLAMPSSQSTSRGSSPGRNGCLDWHISPFTVAPDESIYVPGSGYLLALDAGGQEAVAPQLPAAGVQPLSSAPSGNLLANTE